MFFQHKYFMSLFLCVILLTSGVRASVLKEALEDHLKDIAHKEGAETIKHDKHKIEKNHQVDTEINDSHSNQHSKANDDVKYLKKDHENKSSSEKDEYGGYNANQDKAEDSQSNGFKRGHKKGHHKQGFQNSYHKDESSNKSTFFDDFNDEGDQAGYNSRLNSHDNQGGRSYQGSHNNGQEYVRDNYQGGGYNRYGESGKKHVGHQDHGKKYYLDDNEGHSKYHNDRGSYNRDNIHDRREYRVPEVHHVPGWDWQRWDDRRHLSRPGWDREVGWERDDWGRQGWQRDPGWERDYSGPGYYDERGFRHEGGYGYGPNHGYGYGESRAAPVTQDPKNAPVVAHRKQTITIYEDPRYAGKGADKGQLRREEGDYIQLDFQPSTHRYASYDDTYYNVPIREGGVETSKINRLVYNYRRQ